MPDILEISVKSKREDIHTVVEYYTLLIMKWTASDLGGSSAICTKTNTSATFLRLKPVDGLLAPLLHSN